MKLQFKSGALALAAVAALAVGGNAQAAGAYITSGNITLGVNELGALNVNGGTGAYPGVSLQGTSTVGLRYNTIDASGAPISYASTEPGCLCEGWGAAIVSTGVTGNQNMNVNGTSGSNLTLVSFASTASTATSIVKVGNSLEVTHVYKPSAVAGVYEVDVSIKNISGSALASGDLVYRRVMDWDIEPTAFNEYVTIAGVPAALGIANGSNLLRTGDNGFASADPLSGDSTTISCPANANFTDCGPDDHGALFDFQFGAVAVDETLQFVTYYGAAGNEADALANLAAVGAGIYSLGQSNGGQVTGEPVTFYFGFGSKGGGVLDPNPPGPGGTVPEPGSMALVALGLLGLAGLRQRRKS